MKINRDISSLQNDFYSQIEESKKQYDQDGLPVKNRSKIVNDIKTRCLSPEDGVCWKNNGWAKQIA